MTEDARSHRRPQVGVDNDRLRLIAGDEADSEARVVGQDGADPHQQSVVAGTQAVGLEERVGAAEGQGPAVGSRNTAIQTLGVGQSDKGTAGGSWARCAPLRQGLERVGGHGLGEGVSVREASSGSQ